MSFSLAEFDSALTELCENGEIRVQKRRSPTEQLATQTDLTVSMPLVNLFGGTVLNIVRHGLLLLVPVLTALAAQQLGLLDGILAEELSANLPTEQLRRGISSQLTVRSRMYFRSLVNSFGC